jgi:hypothetical protein
MKEFSLKDYPQSINVFFNSADANFDKNLLSDSYQEHRLTELKHSYFGTASRDNSPWSQTYIELILSQQTNK